MNGFLNINLVAKMEVAVRKGGVGCLPVSRKIAPGDKKKKTEATRYIYGKKITFKT